MKLASIHPEQQCLTVLWISHIPGPDDKITVQEIRYSRRTNDLKLHFENDQNQQFPLTSFAKLFAAVELSL